MAEVRRCCAAVCWQAKKAAQPWVRCQLNEPACVLWAQYTFSLFTCRQALQPGRRQGVPSTLAATQHMQVQCRGAPDGDEVLQALAHAQAVDRQVARVQEVVDPLVGALAAGAGECAARGLSMAALPLTQGLAVCLGHWPVA